MGSVHWLRDRLAQPAALASFDSGTTMVRALANCLHGREFPALGVLPEVLSPLVPYVNYLPRGARTRLYQRASANEAIAPSKLAGVDVEAIRRWVTERYPQRGYPAVVVGSANGAMLHLAALLGVPWLPQTFLIPVRRQLDPDEPQADLEWGREPGRALLSANPDVVLHQLFDPSQDRVPLPELAYFRVKSTRLGRAYREFMESVLAPGGTIVLSACTAQWPVTEVDERHVFQFGCVGDMDPSEYHGGSERVERFLAEQGVDRRRWNAPEPDAEAPDAEWGFQPALGEDAARFADDRGHRLRRLRFDDARALSAPVAEFYRDAYERRGIDADRLIADCFAQLDPWWTLRTGSVPYWLAFTADDDADALEHYLETADPYAEIDATLFSHGVESVGLAMPDRWRAILGRAENCGRFLGMDPDAFPMDFASYVRYNADVPDLIDAREPLLDPVPFERFERFLDERGSWDGVEVDGRAAGQGVRFHRARPDGAKTL